VTLSARDTEDHRRRMLDHQERVHARREAANLQPSDPQLKIPLIGEVRRSEPAPPKRKRQRASKPAQPQLGDV
jgi:hypothetical protein